MNRFPNARWIFFDVGYTLFDETPAWQRLFENVRRSLTAMSLMSLSATLLMGIVGALIMYIGTRQIFAGTAGLPSEFSALLARLNKDD